MARNDELMAPVPIETALCAVEECMSSMGECRDKAVKSLATRMLTLAEAGLRKLLLRRESLEPQDVVFTYDEFCRKFTSTLSPERFASGVHETSLKPLKEACRSAEGGVRKQRNTEFYIALAVVDDIQKEHNPSVGVRWVNVRSGRIARRRVNKAKNAGPDKALLQTLIGLWTDEPAGQEDGVPFQSFDTKDGDFNCPLAYLWASPGSKIWYELGDGDQVGVLRVHFCNKPNGAPANIAIHPTGLVPRKKDPQQRYLTFEMRDASGDMQDDDIEPRGGRTEDDAGVSVAVRVRDANLIQWEFKRGDSRLLEPAEAEWKSRCVDLTYDPAHPKWHEFFPLGVAPKGRPDFSVITTIVFEVGRGDSGHRPGPGIGCVEFRQLLLTSEMPDTDL